MKKIVCICICMLFILTTISVTTADKNKEIIDDINSDNKENEKFLDINDNFDEFMEEVVKETKLELENNSHLKIKNIKEMTKDKKEDISYYIPGEVIVGFKKKVDVSKLEKFEDYSVKSKIEGLNIAVIEVTKETENEFIERIIERDDIHFAEKNGIGSICLDRIPNDINFNSYQWGPQKIKCPKAWSSNTGSPDIKIAILDTGVDYYHQDLAENIWYDQYNRPGIDFVDININNYPSPIYKLCSDEDYFNIDYDPMDIHGHGTHCAGIASAVTNNKKGIAGVAWNCKIMPVRTCFKIEVGGEITGMYENDDLANGIFYAADHGAKVISMSLGDCQTSYAIKAACNYAYIKGAILVAAAGNYGVSTVLFPARYNCVIAVGATDKNNKRCSWSNYGSDLELSAPGKDIYSTWPGNSYKTISGTSSACPHVSGVAALYFSEHPNYGPSLCRLTLRSSATNLGLPGKDRYYGYGLVDATLK